MTHYRFKLFALLLFLRANKPTYRTEYTVDSNTRQMLSDGSW